LRTPIETAPPVPANIRLEISANPAFADQEVRIRLTGALPRQIVRLRSVTQDDDNRPWSSRADFRADSSGTIDLASAAPISGDYKGVSPMGLLWSMHLASEHRDGRAIFAKKTTETNVIDFTAETHGRAVASVSLQRTFLALGTEVRDLRVDALQQGENIHASSHDGDSACARAADAPAGYLIARLFIPPADATRASSSKLPVVIVLGGSGGGFDLDKAAVLSRHGFATLALAYFGVPPLPAWLHRVPLDYFESALAWLASHRELDVNRLGVLGVSRGAELSLLLASTFPQIRAVVAFAPSSVAWAAGGREKETGEEIPAWTFRGAPVPFASLPLRGFMLRSAVPVVLFRRPVIFRNLFRAAFRNREAVGRGAIPVENIRGPILLISGGDDHLWPAAEMAEAILARLKSKGFTHSANHLYYPYAGHMLRYPFLPTTCRESRNSHLRNAKFSYGGTPAADAAAQADSWPRAIAFLQSKL
jgi:dienelactone hydrolase